MIEEIKKYAALFFKPREIAYLIDVDVDNFIDKINDDSTDEHRTYMIGILSAEVKLRTGLVEMAEFGSPKAQEELARIIVKTKANL